MSPQDTRTQDPIKARALGDKRPKNINEVQQKRVKHEQQGGRYYPAKQEQIFKGDHVEHIDEWAAYSKQINDYHLRNQA